MAAVLERSAGVTMGSCTITGERVRSRVPPRRAAQRTNGGESRVGVPMTGGRVDNG